MRARRWTIAVLLMLAFAIPALAQAQAYRLYLAPDGDDTATGTSAAAPLQSLSAAHAHLLAAPPPQDASAVEIVIAPGTYLGQSVNWTFFNGKPISLVAAAGASARPLFDGRGGGTWFTLYKGANRATQLRFVGLKVSNYWMAIDLGTTTLDKGGNSGNEIRDMVFARIGGLHGVGEQAYSFAAVRLRNSRDNVIADNQFVSVENDEETSGYIHALYLSQRSSGNLVQGNTFTDVNGDVIRTRDASDDTEVRGNTFVRAGKYAAFSDWIKEADGECPSQGGLFVDNTVGAGYYGQIPATRTWGADDACGALNAPRITESGTVRN
ncbi:right-handed parallel beta-helix repeat-containing protein [Xanthomonas sp. AmX2]|nr:right-handed parallel beta-helix repeat-containing protein [Xanthomonas sp.]